MALALVRDLGDGRLETMPQVAEAFAAAADREGGWVRALEALRRAVGAEGAELTAMRGGRVWAAAACSRVRPGPGDVVRERLVAAGGVEFELRVHGRWGLEGRPAAEARLRHAAPAAAEALRTELRVRNAALQMSLGLLRGAGLQPLVCEPDGTVAPDSARGDAAPGVGPLKVVAGRVCGSTRADDAALRAALALAWDQWRRTVVVLGRDGEQSVVLDVLPQPEPDGARFLGQVVLLPRARACEAAERNPIVQRIFGLTPSEAAVALGIADGVSVPEIAESRGVAASTVRAQLKRILSKVGVRRQVELAHRLRFVG